MKLWFLQIKYGRKPTVFYSSNCASSTMFAFNMVIVAILSLPTLQGVYQLVIALKKKNLSKFEGTKPETYHFSWISGAGEWFCCFRPDLPNPDWISHGSVIIWWEGWSWLAVDGFTPSSGEGRCVSRPPAGQPMLIHEVMAKVKLESKGSWAQAWYWHSIISAASFWPSPELVLRK